ncbi:metallophosphoesterase [Streptomyces sp. NBC_01803]|uniref:metallophosphoesterase n=1 Tax=Streptomyces sp. NBC_01803 TaxID=2975946 RepID=UPI002DD9DE65|nr:metallophosphoesterase [Streptomyces sp. NBC_01803]WSA45871.1 metallophosphoesterase [Streptomyces sp. NBC_01803]
MLIGAAVVFSLLLTGTHWYLWRRLVRDVSAPGGWYRRIGTAAVVVLPLLSMLATTGREIGIPFGVLQALAWPGNYWLAMLLYLMLLLVPAELLRWALLRRTRTPVPATATATVPDAEAARSTEPVAVGAAAGVSGAGAGGGAAVPDEEPEITAPPGAGAGDAAREADALSRRLLVSRGIAVGAGVVAAGVVGYGSYAARRLTTKRVGITLAKLPRAAHGYRIAVVSDIHLGPILGRAHCQNVVDHINRAQPDLVTVVGDLVDAEVDDLRSAAAPLAGLRARDGAYFVTGNHEYYLDTRAWVDHVRELGLTPLVNARDELPYFDLAGVNDADGEGSDFGGPDFEAALGDRDRRRATVLMAHQPVQIHDAVDYGVDLQLSGHTHGGQLWPFTYLADLSNPTLAGLERYGDTQLYVTRGAGAWGPPVRVGADPDITIIELASAQA